MVKTAEHREGCPQKLKATRDVLELIQGKWRIPVIVSLSYGEKRFGEIKRDISDISPKILSQELKALELNGMISRKVIESHPVTVRYSLTELGHSINPLLNELLNWGLHFRNAVLQA